MTSTPATAMLLAAGEGRRLRPLTQTTPKALVRIGDRPLIAHQLGWLAAKGVQRVVINLHHLGDQIRDVVGDGRDFGLDIAYSMETELLETGGGIVNALPLLGEAPFVVVNADVWLDFASLKLDAHLPDGRLAELVLTPKPAFRERGDFLVDNGTISARGDDYVYCGVSVHHPRFFTGRSVQRFSLAELWFENVGTGVLGAQIYHGYWTDIGTIDQLTELQQQVAASD